MQLIWSAIVFFALFITINSAEAAEYPIVFVHGWCSDSNTWNTMFNNLPRERFGEGLTRYFQSADGSVQLNGSPQSGRRRSFTIDFYDRTNNTFDKRAVADILINTKAEQLKAVIDEIKKITGQPKVIVVSHSMGGLVARSYIQGWGLSSLGEPIAYSGDVAGLITIDTPHSGADLADKPIDLFDWVRTCMSDATINKAEMLPESNYLNTINNRPWPNNTRLDAIVSYSLDVIPGFLIPDTDGFVTRESQDIRTISEYWATHPYIQTHLHRFLNPFLIPGLFLHVTTHRSPVTSSRVQTIVEEIDAAVSLTGTVTASGSGVRIGGATIRILDGVNAGRSATTNANGEYWLDGLISANANLSVTVPGYEESRDGLFIDGINTLNFTLHPSLKTIIGGRVFDTTNNQSIFGVSVEVLGTGLRTTTDSNGQYRLGGINATTFTTRYSHPAYRTLDFEYTFRPGTERLDLVTGLTPIPRVSVYDGSWTGSGSGKSSGSTPASTQINFQVFGGQVTLNFTWIIQQLPPYPSGFICPGSGKNIPLKLVNNSFIFFNERGDVYHTRITGTFTSPTTVSGTASFQRVGSSWPQCPSATMNWTGRKQ